MNLHDIEIIRALELSSDINNLNCKPSTSLCREALAIITRQKEEIERLKEIAESPILGKLIYVWENEAIKAFAEKLKANMHQIQVGNHKFNIITDYGIDNYVKEMVGEE